MTTKQRIYGAGALCMAVLLSGCSILSSDKSTDPGPSASARESECRHNRSKCMYEGSYEPGERNYAEQEAKRLNKAALERFRRSAGR